MKILFIRPPRYLWPLHSPASSFWQPLGFASMAAVLRQNLNSIEIKIKDCPAEKIGWKSTKKILEKEKPDVLCIGEETVSAHEALRLVDHARTLFPECIIIAGGFHFSYMVKDSLTNNPIDYIVHGEGELTLLELVKEIKKHGGKPPTEVLKKIKGISFLDKEEVKTTKQRPLLDMDLLPMPAYDLLNMEVYGKGASSHRDLVAVEHSRGCPCSCNFCVLWKHFSEYDYAKNKAVACYRTKSVKKTIEEISIISEKYKRKTFGWVDPTWNADPKWNLDFSKAIKDYSLDVDHLTWMRADFLIRDHKKGILKDQVNAGIKQVIIGVERLDEADLNYFAKDNYSFAETKKAFEIIRKFPDVLSVATYIYGVPYETQQTLKNFYAKLVQIPFDIGVPIPLTPNPGTKYYEELKKEGLLEIEDFSFYNFVNPLARSKHLSRNMLLFNVMINEIKRLSIKEQFGSHLINKIIKRRKNAVKNLARSKARTATRYVWGMIQDSVLGKPYNYNIKPKWYDS